MELERNRSVPIWLSAQGKLALLKDQELVNIKAEQYAVSLNVATAGSKREILTYLCHPSPAESSAGRSVRYPLDVFTRSPRRRPVEDQISVREIQKDVHEAAPLCK